MILNWIPVSHRWISSFRVVSESGEMKIDDVEIPDEQVNEFKEAFAEFDINSDGTITRQELGTLFY